MNILVIGGTRFMGKHLVESLLQNNHQVTIASRGITPDHFSKRVKRIIFDRNDEKSIQDHLSSLTFDVVYDSLAYASYDVKRLLTYLHCQKYIMISSAAVYNLHMNTIEEEFNPYTYPLKWCNKNDFSYKETKRQAECALVQDFPHIKSIYVRFPFVIGKDDYTNRLRFYVEHIINQKPMFIDNIFEQLAFVYSHEAGSFLALLADKDFTGAINGNNIGSISIQEIIDYVQDKTHKTAILNEDGDVAPYNNAYENTLNINKANSLGFNFTPLKEQLFNLLDNYIKITTR